MTNATTKTDRFGNDTTDVTGIPVRGVFETPEGWEAITPSQSRTFKTRAGAERWYARRTAYRAAPAPRLTEWDRHMEQVQRLERGW